jgi:glucosamine kinase
MTTLVIGVDGGGTKTRVIIADEQGTELASVTGPASAVHPGFASNSADVIAALAECDLVGTTARVLCAGVAGAGRDQERHALQAALERLELADEVLVVADATLALDDAFGEGPGIVLVAGTGSACFGRSPTETFARCGGWGPICGDEGSGAWIGKRALSVVTASADGREPDTALLGVILTHLQMEAAEELIPWASNATSADFAALAAEELVLHVRTLARQLFNDERAAIPVALAGGMLNRGSYLRKLVEMRLKSAVPGSQLHSPEVVPARAAVRHALLALAKA